MFTSHITTASIFTQELGSMANFSYIIADKSTALATVIDPAWEVSKIIAVLTKHSFFDDIHGLSVIFWQWILFEHLCDFLISKLPCGVLLLIIFHHLFPFMCSLSTFIALLLKDVHVTSDCLVLEEEALISKGRSVELRGQLYKSNSWQLIDWPVIRWIMSHPDSEKLQFDFPIV